MSASCNKVFAFPRLFNKFLINLQNIQCDFALKTPYYKIEM